MEPVFTARVAPADPPDRVPGPTAWARGRRTTGNANGRRRVPAAVNERRRS